MVEIKKNGPVKPKRRLLSAIELRHRINTHGHTHAHTHSIKHTIQTHTLTQSHLIDVTDRVILRKLNADGSENMAFVRLKEKFKKIIENHRSLFPCIFRKDAKFTGTF